MASTFSPSLRIQLIGTGDQSGVWGQTTNNNLGGLIEQAIAGVTTINILDANYTLTNFNGIIDEARNAVITITGSLSQQRNIVVPLADKIYTFHNATTGGFPIQIIASSGTGTVIPNGVTASVYCNGANVLPLNTGTVDNYSVNGNLNVTGTTTLTGALGGSTAVFSGAVSSVSPTFTGTPTAPTAAPGTNTTQIATTAFVLANGIPSGVIVMWSGSIASIPSGWLLCNGSSGTPDLRDRFVVGAGSTYAVAATGGSANAIVVSHTHTATATTAAAHNHYVFEGAGYAYGYGNTAVPNQSLSNGLSDGGASSYLMSGPNTTTDQPKANFGLSSNAGAHTHDITVSTTGSSDINANLPPYYALAYIMKS